MWMSGIKVCYWVAVLAVRVVSKTSARHVAYRLIFEGPFAPFAVNCWRPRSREIIAKHVQSLHHSPNVTSTDTVEFIGGILIPPVLTCLVATLFRLACTEHFCNGAVNDSVLPLCHLSRSLAVGTKSGYKFFSLSSVDKLEQIYECSK